MSNYTPPGFDEDVYFGEDDAPVLAIAQPMDVIVSGWPECEFGEPEAEEMPMAA